MRCPNSILDEERRKREIDEILLRRWEEFNKPRPKPVPKSVPKPVEKPVNKTTDDLSTNNKSLSYKDKDGKPLDALVDIKDAFENAKS